MKNLARTLFAASAAVIALLCGAGCSDDTAVPEPGETATTAAPGATVAPGTTTAPGAAAPGAPGAEAAPPGPAAAGH